MKDHLDLVRQTDLKEIKSSEEPTIKKQLGNLKGISFLRHSISKIPVAGYGKCRSCDCRGYISKHNGSHECKNCNHHFDRHWD